LAAAEQAWQRPVHEVLQQTPSTQKPEVHWLERLQALPSPDPVPHTPPLHVKPAAHCAFELHGFVHTPDAHA
jgi:hypothetical protein